MNSPQIKYRGHVITFGENSDEWSCLDLGPGFANASLRKVKASIDKMYLDQRKKAAVACFELRGGYSDRPPDAVEGSIIEYVGPVAKMSYRSSDPASEGHKVAVVAKRHGRERAARAEAEISDLMPDTPEAHAALAEAEAAHEKARIAFAIFREAFNRIPRISPEDIAELIRIKKTDQEGNS